MEPQSQSPKKFIAGSLKEAIKHRDEYPQAIGFVVAPLKTRTGARAWHGIDRESRTWQPLGDDGVAVPSIDNGDQVPPLPDTPLRLWAFAYIGSDSVPIRPTWTIDPAFNVASTVEAADPEQPQAAPAPQVPKQPRPEYDPSAIVTAVLELTAQKDAHALLVLKEAQLLQTQAWGKLIGLLEHHEKALDRSEQERAASLAQVREVVGINAKLANDLAEAKNDDQMWKTIQECFKDKPELLVDSAKGLLIAIFEKLKA